jgi:hypothetical protein
MKWTWGWESSRPQAIHSHYTQKVSAHFSAASGGCMSVYRTHTGDFHCPAPAHPEGLKITTANRDFSTSFF